MKAVKYGKVTLSLAPQKRERSWYKRPLDEVLHEALDILSLGYPYNAHERADFVRKAVRAVAEAVIDFGGHPCPMKVQFLSKEILREASHFIDRRKIHRRN